MSAIKSKTVTESSGIVALSVAVTFAMSQAYIPAAIAGAIGLGLLLAYEYLGLKDLKLTRAEVQEFSEETGKTLDEEIEERTD